jgi:hypothetical protein
VSGVPECAVVSLAASQPQSCLLPGQMLPQLLGWAGDRQVVAGFVEVTGGPGVEESSFDEL